MPLCKAFFGKESKYFQMRDCINTATEIAGQSLLWRELAGNIVPVKPRISEFIQTFGGFENVRVVLAGAGSSACVCEALAGFAAKSAGVKCDAVHTTDLVSAPETVLFADIPTLLVSFGRSGNSPESTGAVEHARKIVKNLYEVAIVCDSTSNLFKITAESEKSLILVTPEGSNDRSFAMTASVTCMLLAGFAFLNYKKIEEVAKDMEILAEHLESTSLRISEMAEDIAKKSFGSAVYLGSGANKGIMHEGSLKMTELTNGAISTIYDSAAGFRRKPKAVIKNDTVSIHFISNDPLTAKYDMDLQEEIQNEKDKNLMTVIRHESLNCGITDELCIGIDILVFLQTLAMYKSLELKVPTDDPTRVTRL